MNTDTHRNGCYDRKPLRGHALLGIDWSEGHPLKAVRVQLEHRMARDCQYTLSALGQVDKGCVGCKHKKGEL